MKAVFWLSASVVALMGSGVAQAQDGPGEAPQTDVAAADSQAGGEIVVTAERRTTNLQQTGIAATVLSSELFGLSRIDPSRSDAWTPAAVSAA